MNWELILTCVVPIAELGQKCPKAASTLKYEPLNSCITVHSVCFQIYRPHTFELKSISKYQLLFHWKSFENIWSFILYLEAGETELINTCAVPFAIAVFGQKCLEAASTLKYEPLNSCITAHSVWIMKIFNVILPNTCSRNKRRKNCEESRWRSHSALVRP